MRKLSNKEKRELRDKLQEERQRRHETILEIARQSDEADMGAASGAGGRGLSSFLARYIGERMPGAGFRTRLVLTFLLSILLPIIFALIILVIFHLMFGTPIRVSFG